MAYKKPAYLKGLLKKKTKQKRKTILNHYFLQLQTETSLNSTGGPCKQKKNFESIQEILKMCSDLKYS